MTDHSALEIDSQTAWRMQTEYIIAAAEVVFAMLILLLYFGFNSSGGASEWQGLTRTAVVAFPLTCFARLAYVRWGTPNEIFGWVSLLIDIAFLSGIIFIFSLQYGTSAASLQAPGFAYYFVLIALHAMRFRVSMVVAGGVLASLAWAGMLIVFLSSGGTRTRAYIEYISSSDILVGAEIEKIIALLAYTAMLALGVKRASAVLQDAAEKEVVEVRMREAQKTAQHKTDFLANMSHEIRTPMNGVLGMTQILQTTELSLDQKEYVDTIQRSGGALLTVINDILDFSKIEAGKLRLDAAPFDLREACEDVTTLLGVTARDKGLELIMSMHPEMPVNLMGDAGRLRQVLTNLIGNAIKFTPEGHVLCEVNGVEKDGVAHLSISVKDTGIGIKKDQLETIFKEFSQADNSTTRKFGGTGLGLSISKNLVALMDGKLTATSTPGEGSKFTFTATLPLDRRKHAAKQRPSIVDLTTTPILVVDDLDVNREILRLQLRNLGAKPDFAKDARQAVSAIVGAYNRGHPYAIVLTDYQMPEIDGLELVEGIRKRDIFDTLQLIVLSSIDDAKAKAAFLAHDGVAYTTKPCRNVDLEDAVYAAASRYKTKQLQKIAVENAAPKPDKPTATDKKMA